MERVYGIGGVFFRASDSPAVAEWYETHLGARKTPDTHEEASWCRRRARPFSPPSSPTPATSATPPDKWMVNFRVDDLDAMAAQLFAAGIDLEIEEEVFPQWALRSPERFGGEPDRALGAGRHRSQRA